MWRRSWWQEFAVTLYKLQSPKTRKRPDRLYAIKRIFIVSGTAILRYLLTTDAELTHLVPEQNILVGIVPINWVLPAISVRKVDAAEYRTIDRIGPQLISERVQVTVLAPTHELQDQIFDLVRPPLRRVRGEINGFNTESIRSDIEYGDQYNEIPIIYMQSIDYIVRYIRNE